MKVGFVVNIMLLLCFVCSQLLIWLIDATLVMTLAELLNMQSNVFCSSRYSHIREEPYSKPLLKAQR